MIKQETAELIKLKARDSKFVMRYTTTADILATLTSTEEFIKEEDQWRYAPFDGIIVYNGDVVDLEIVFNNNPDTVLVIKAGSTIGLDKLKYRQIAIKNKHAVTKHTAGKVDVTVLKGGF